MICVYSDVQRCVFSTGIILLLFTYSVRESCLWAYVAAAACDNMPPHCLWLALISRSPLHNGKGVFKQLFLKIKFNFVYKFLYALGFVLFHSTSGLPGVTEFTNIMYVAQAQQPIINTLVFLSVYIHVQNTWYSRVVLLILSMRVHVCLFCVDVIHCTILGEFNICGCFEL